MFLLILFTCSQLFRPTSCPSARISKCGLASQNKLEASRRSEMITHKDFRRYTGDVDPKHPWWTIKDPRELSLLAPTTTPPITFYKLSSERCDYKRMRCMEAYATGVICARTFYYQYSTFKSYCIMVYHNCVARYDNVWSIAYMGYCTEVDMDKNLYVDMTYDQMADNSKLLSMYVADSADKTDFESYASTIKVVRQNTTRPLFDRIMVNVTDNSGNLVTNNDGSFVTVIEIGQKTIQNVTDSEGKPITDKQGQYVTTAVVISPTTIAPTDTNTTH